MGVRKNNWVDFCCQNLIYIFLEHYIKKPAEAGFWFTLVFSFFSFPLLLASFIKGLLPEKVIKKKSSQKLT